jgi:hypothetical protein
VVIVADPAQLRHRIVRTALPFEDYTPIARPVVEKPAPVIVLPTILHPYIVERTHGMDLITKRDWTGARVIHGTASTSTINSHGYSLNSSGCSVKLPIPIYSQHACAGESIGEIVHLRKSALGIFVIGTIKENNLAADHAWALIEDGTLRAFSGAAAPGSTHLQGIVEGVKYFDRWRLSEVSIVKNGANPDCRFEIREQKE